MKIDLMSNQKYNQKSNECYTPREVVEAIKDFIPFKPSEGKVIWCPFDKEEHFYGRVLREWGYKVVLSHIDGGKDFFEYEPDEWDCIISNPPFTMKRKILVRCYNLGKPFALLLPVSATVGNAAYDLKKKYGMDVVEIRERPNFTGGTGSWFGCIYWLWKFKTKAIGTISLVSLNKSINKEIEPTLF